MLLALWCETQIVSVAIQTNKTLSLKGEILDILNQNDSQKIRIICKPEWIILDLDRTEEFHLNDKIYVSGNLEITDMYKLDLEKKENSLI